MPGNDAGLARAGASAACWQVYGEVAGYEAAHLAQLGRFHQLMVDAYAAQHPTADGPTIGLAFALIGLRLALDEGWRGDQVRDAHQYLAGRFKDWPSFQRPPGRAALTVFDVALAGSPDAHAELIRRWAAEVWAIWESQSEATIELLDERLPTDVRGHITRD